MPRYAMWQNLCERKHKVWVAIFLDRNEVFGTKFIVFLEFSVFVLRASSFSVGRRKHYATSSYV